MTNPISLLRWGLRPIRAVLPSRPGRGPVDDKGDQDDRGDRPQDLDAAIQRTQLEILVSQLGAGKGVRAHDAENPDEAYLYRPGRLLVRSEDLPAVTRFFQERAKRWGGVGRSTPVVEGLHHYVLPRRVEVPTALDELEKALGDDIARPEHVVYVTPQVGTGKLCPADEPRAPRAARPVPGLARDRGAGAGVRVSVVDTGWWEPAETTGLSPWLHDVDGDPETIDQHDIHSYAGHGTFVAGVVRCLAPAVGIEVEGLLPHGGAAYETDIVRELDEAVVEEFDPHIISISAGTYTRKDRGLLAFDVFASTRKLLWGEGDLVIVAAAGNDSTTRRFFPAAYDWAVGVGALDADATVSTFSNTGPWVDVYAHGKDLVNAYPAGTYVCKEPPHTGEVRHFKGLAQWSGTSFATPIVSGAIAARMSATPGATARGALDELIAEGRSVVDPGGAPITAIGPPFT